MLVKDVKKIIEVNSSDTHGSFGAHFDMEHWVGKTALVTGASAGIGYDLSSRLCELGMNVVGCARNIEKIEVRAS